VISRQPLNLRNLHQTIRCQIGQGAPDRISARARQRMGRSPGALAVVQILRLPRHPLLRRVILLSSADVVGADLRTPTVGTAPLRSGRAVTRLTVSVNLIHRALEPQRNIT
jgi:hypothetical protein